MASRSRASEAATLRVGQRLPPHPPTFPPLGGGEESRGCEPTVRASLEAPALQRLALTASGPTAAPEPSAASTVALMTAGGSRAKVIGRMKIVARMVSTA